MSAPREHLAVACGGTGGHFFPTLAVATEFRAGGGRVTLLVAGHHSTEQLNLARERGFDAVAVPAVRVPGRSPALLLFPVRLLAAMRRAQATLRPLAPDVVLGMGSFAAVPACLAAARLNLPIVLHEANSHIGRANRFLARWARALGTSLPVRPDQRCGCPRRDVGVPLRPDVIGAARNGAAPLAFRAGLGLQPDLPTLLVFGGSQGARFLNELMTAVAGQLGPDAARLQVIHLTGTDDNTALETAYRGAGLRAAVRRADPHIENDYLAADLVVCRAGASTIAELALFGKPAVLIPLPSAAEDHQTANARMLMDRQAGRWLRQTDASPAAMAELLRDWLRSPQPWQALGATIRTLARPDAAKAMVALLHECARAR